MRVQPTRLASRALVHAPPAPSPSGRPKTDTSLTSAEVWQSMHPENMLRGVREGDGVHAGGAEAVPTNDPHPSERKVSDGSASSTGITSKRPCVATRHPGSRANITRLPERERRRTAQREARILSRLGATSSSHKGIPKAIRLLPLGHDSRVRLGTRLLICSWKHAPRVTAIGEKAP